MSDDVSRLIGLDEEDDRAEELRTILLALKNRKLDDYTAGVLNARVLALLNVRWGGKVRADDVAKATGQARRTFYRRLQLARELAPEQFEDLREEVGKRRLTAAQALELVKLRQEGHKVAASAQALRHVTASQQRKRLTATDQAKLEGFVEGAQWAYRALMQELPNDDWVRQLADDWRESKR